MLISIELNPSCDLPARAFCPQLRIGRVSARHQSIKLLPFSGQQAFWSQRSFGYIQGGGVRESGVPEVARSDNKSEYFARC